MFLFTKLVRSFTKNTLKVWSEANPVFKDYYSKRLTLSPHELQVFLIKATTKKFSESDHRWISLLQNIQISLSKFQLQSRLYMLKALVGMQSKSELVQKLMQSILLEIKQLNFEEASIFLWSLSKCPHSKKIETTTKIYQQLCQILANYENQEGNITIVISKESKQLQRKILSLKSTSICMVLSAMANLGISQKTVLKHLLKSGIRPNLAAFATNGLVTLLVSLQKLGLRNRKDALFIYLEIRKRHKELQTGSLQTIINLAWAVANFTLSKHFQIQNNQQHDNKIKDIKEDLKKFLLWLCQTLILRQKQMKIETGAKILHYCGKAETYNLEIWSKALNVLCINVQDCKIIDLVMALRAITRLLPEERLQIKKQEQIISKRLWILHSSIAAKSLQILAHLYATKKINPPPKISQILKDHNSKKQAMFKRKPKDEKLQANQG